MNPYFSYMISPQYVYMTKNKSSENTLELIITNYSSESAVIENPDCLAPDDYPAYDDLPKENDPAGFYVYFNYGGCSGDLTTEDDGADMMLGVLSSDWEVSWVMDSESVGAYWIIAPKKTIAIAAHDSISVKISNIRCNGIAGETPVHIAFRNKGEMSLDQINIYKMFKLDCDLSFKAVSEYFTVDHKESLDVMITNNSSSPLTFQNGSSLAPENYPAYDDFLAANQAAGFYLYFYYGGEGGEIVTKEESVNYSVSVVNKSNWRVSYGDSPTVGRYWKICPAETSVMKPHESLKLCIENLNINKESGLTPLNIELRADCKILPDRLDLIKLNEPVVKSFGPEREDGDINETVTFRWEVENGEECSYVISNSSGITDVTGYDKYDLKLIDSAYTLTVKNRAGCPVSKSFTPSFTFITCFQAIDCDGEHVTLKWETRNGGKCRISGAGEVELSGTKKVPAKKGSADVFRFTLVLTQKDSFLEHEQTLEFGYAKITQFNRNSKLYRALPNLSAELSEKTPFVTMDEIEHLPAVPIITLPYDGGWTPPEWHDGLEWDGQYVESYELVGYKKYTGGGYHWVCMSDSKSQCYTLRAYSIGQKVYDERSI